MQQSVVRAIDKEVVRLINRAVSAAAASTVGTNQNFGVPIEPATTTTIKIQEGTTVQALRRSVTVKLSPPEAVASGAAWMIPGRVTSFTNAAEVTLFLPTGTNYALVFSAASGFQTPAARTVPVGSESSAAIVIEQTYVRTGTVSSFYLTNRYSNRTLQLILVGPDGNYQIESRPDLRSNSSWQLFQSALLTNGRLWTNTISTTSAPSQFFRARVAE